MIKFIIKRLLMVIPVMIGVTFLLFMLLTLTPGDPAVAVLGTDATEEQLYQFREQNGLNDPALIQYVKYMGKVFTGDLGTSFNTRQPVNDMIATRAPATLFLSFASMALTILVSLPIGVQMALKQNSLFDNVMRVLTIVFTSMPQFWLALMMILFFSVKLGWLPSSGLNSVASSIMPVLCLMAGGVTTCARTGRSSMLEVLNQDYIRTAHSKGLDSGYVVRKHALKNALLPMITVYGRIVATCFSGSVVLEQVFGINGIGQMMMSALRQKDVPAIMGCIVVSAFVIVLVNLATDLAYAFVDPRIKSKYIKPKIKIAKEGTTNAA